MAWPPLLGGWLPPLPFPLFLPPSSPPSPFLPPFLVDSKLAFYHVALSIPSLNRVRPQSRDQTDGETLDEERQSRSACPQHPGCSEQTSSFPLWACSSPLPRAVSHPSPSVIRCYLASALATPILSSAQADLRQQWSSTPFAQLQACSRGSQVPARPVGTPVLQFLSTNCPYNILAASFLFSEQ